MPTRPRLALSCHARWATRAAFYLQPSYIFHSNTYSTAGCLEHIEHGHDIPGCADLDDDGHRVEHAAGGAEHSASRASERLPGGIVDAPRERLPAWRLVEDVRHREAAARARVSAELLERPRHDDGRDGPRRVERQRLVPRLQYLEEVLLIEGTEGVSTRR